MWSTFTNGLSERSSSKSTDMGDKVNNIWISLSLKAIRYPVGKNKCNCPWDNGITTFYNKSIIYHLCKLRGITS